MQFLWCVVVLKIERRISELKERSMVVGKDEILLEQLSIRKQNKRRKCIIAFAAEIDVLQE